MSESAKGKLTPKNLALMVIAGFILIAIIISTINGSKSNQAGNNVADLSDQQTQTKTQNKTSVQLTETTETKPAETKAPLFTLQSEKSENGAVYIDYAIGDNDSFFNLFDNDKQALEQSVYDDALSHLSSDYPGLSKMSVTVYTTTSDAAFAISKPNDIATPKVYFYKYKTGSGSVHDYEWYDDRYGNGQTW
jgi:hypothetical protein